MVQPALFRPGIGVNVDISIDFKKSNHVCTCDNSKIMSRPAAPPGSACLPLGRRFYPINSLNLWPVALSDHILKCHYFALTQASTTQIAQRIHYSADVFKRCCMNIPCPWRGYIEPLKTRFHKQIAIPKWRWGANAINHPFRVFYDLFYGPFGLIA